MTHVLIAQTCIGYQKSKVPKVSATSVTTISRSKRLFSFKKDREIVGSYKSVSSKETLDCCLAN